MQLPYFQTQDQVLNQLQTKWISLINPILSKPLTEGISLPIVKLVTGTNVISHRLGRQMQGWIISDIDAGITLYRSAPLNDKTLTLTASAPALLSLWVF